MTAEPTRSELTAELTLPELIDNVRASEALFDDIEFTLTRDYVRLLSDPLGGDAVRSQRSRSRVIMQQGMIFFDHECTAVDNDGDSRTLDSLQGFDGEVTRLVEQNVVANVIHGRSRDPRIVHPHLLLMSRWNTTGTLADFLSGRAYKDYFTDVRIEGVETVDGLECYKIVAESREKKEDPQIFERSFLWIAPDRNYFVVRTFGHRLVASEELPIEEGALSDFRELAPGVWFPFAFSIVVNDAVSLQKGIVKIDNRESGAFENVSLSPNYPVSQFRDIPFPDGIPVHVVKDGVIVKSYSTAQAKAAEGRGGAGALIMWLCISAGALLVGLVLVKCLRRGDLSMGPK